MYITQLYIDVSIQKLIIEKISEMQKEKTWLISVKCDSFKYSVSTLHMWFTKVPISIINKIKSSLDIIISNLCKNGINIETMNNLIHQSILQRQRKLESNPHDIISQSVFDHMVYGNTDNAECESKDLEERLHTIRQLEKLKTESVEYFLELLKTYFLDVPMVVVKGKPNVDEYNKLQEEKNYIDEHIAKLYVLVDTSSISNEYRKYIPLLLEVIRESIKKRTDLGDITTQIGYISPHSISLLFQMEVHNYEKGVQLYKQLVFDTELTADKLTILITQVTNSLKQTTRKDNCILHTLMIILLYNTDDFPFSFNIYQLYVLCSQIRDYLNTAGEKKVLEEIEYVRKTMTSPQNMFVYMAVNVDKLTKHVPDVYAPWNKFFSDFMTSKKTKPNVTSDWEFLKPFNDITENGYIQSSEYVQLSSFVQVCPCINDCHDPDLAALLVCLQYFSQMDGPLWKVMKAKEWSCDFIIFANPIKGLLNLQLSTATDIVAAYKKTKWIVESHITKAKWVQHLYDSAKSLAILKYVNEGKSMIDVIYTSFERYCRNLPPDYNSLMVRRISAVTMDDMSRVAASYVKSLFDPKRVKTAIICNKSKFAEITKAFEGMKYNFTKINSNVL
ncbi:uncharacterized protein LOC109858800 isoform X2 [Pseudomyrmex gracilis]|uniref:uncharacterized protein LOC109858800 isoform X2 n=1 Tax=Pseudomyrmex gracilis TaxID=219809 RepID=UPI0009959BB5|nr:uncharacterized protein LOC109858800 isoform X2 [Pseudomyrmex gracilis]